MQIALLNNRGLQAAYNELGIAEAAMVQASLPPNPSFSFSRISGSLESELEATVAANILALATLPAQAEIAADQFRAAQLRAAEETLRVAAETRRNYYTAVAAQELVGFLTQANTAAETAAKLAGKLGETGAMNKLDQARDQVFHAEVTAELAAARQQAASEREQLIRSLGLWGSDLDFKLPNALPALPQHPRTLPTVEQDAISRRVRSPDRAHRTRSARKVLWAHERDKVRQSVRAVWHLQGHKGKLRHRKCSIPGFWTRGHS